MKAKKLGQKNSAINQYYCNRDASPFEVFMINVKKKFVDLWLSKIPMRFVYLFRSTKPVGNVQIMPVTQCPFRINCDETFGTKEAISFL